jgi:Na+/melibiose symporter-like transporter
MRNVTANTPLSRATRLYYGFGSVAYGVKDNGFAYMLLIYYNQVLGLRAELASLAIFSALILDALSDPIVGGVSDRLHSRWGRRHPFMYAAVVPVALAYYALWNPPALDEGPLFVYLLVCAVTVRTLITFFEVPSTAMGPELTEDYDERTLLMSTRYFFAWAGGISLMVLAYQFLFVPTDTYPTGQLNPAGYKIYGACAAALMGLAMLVSALGTHAKIPELRSPPPRQRFSVRRIARELRETLSNRSFFALFGFGLFAAMAAGLAAAMNVYLNTFFWELAAAQISLVVFSSFFSAGLAFAFTPRAAVWLGKRKAAISIAVAAALFAPVPVVLRLLGWMPLNHSPELLPLLVAYNVLEVCLVIMASTLVSAMMADVVEQSELATGRRSEGTFFAARSFIQKSLTGLGLVLATVLLTSVDFPADAVPGEVAAATLHKLGLGYAPLVTGLYGVAIACLLGYRINRADHEQNLELLAAERKTSSA